MTSASIDDLLTQSGFDDQANLRALLGEIEALGAGDAPEPSAEVLALMVLTTGVPRRSFRARHRTPIIIAAVVASLGMGATAAAAAVPEVRHAAQNVIEAVIHAVAPDSDAKSAPSGVPSHQDGPVPSTQSSDSHGQGTSTTTKSVPETKSTNAPSSPPRATVVPANPHATAAPVAPPAKGLTTEHTPPARPHAP